MDLKRLAPARCLCVHKYLCTVCTQVPVYIIFNRRMLYWSECSCVVKSCLLFGYLGEASLPALQCWAFLCLCTITISGVRGFKVLIFSEKCNNFSEYTVWVIRRYSLIECYMYIPSSRTSNLMHPFVHICT